MSVKLMELREPRLDASEPRLEAREPRLLLDDTVRELADRLWGEKKKGCVADWTGSRGRKHSGWTGGTS